MTTAVGLQATGAPQSAGAAPMRESLARSLDGLRVLYLSYDGLTDPLGQSQVIPYVIGLSARGASVHIVSFEKPERYRSDEHSVRRQVNEGGVGWTPLRYTKFPPVASAVWDAARMWRTARALHKARTFDIVHCRSYLPSLVGIRLKRKYGVRFLFDMRGFWADERVDAGLWRLDRRLYRLVYRYFKAREREFLNEADAVVSLTHAAMEDIREPYPRVSSRGWVIPCSVDYERFDVVVDRARAAARQALGISNEAIVPAYLGSMGTWYLLDEMLDFFRVFISRRPSSRFLIVTPDDPGPILQRAAERGVPPELLVIRFVPHAGVPKLLAAADFGLFFIRPQPSKRSSSPTKLAEFLAMGLPVLTNRGIGDVERDLRDFDGGLVIDAFDTAEYQRATDALESLLDRSGAALRERSRHRYGLEHAVDRYEEVYASLQGSRAG